MNNNLSFHPSLVTTFQGKTDLNYWDTVLQLFEKKKYADSIRAIIHYLDPGIEIGPAKTSYTIPHGSIILQLEITETQLQIQAPFLSVTGSKLVPLLRQAAQLNFSPLSIAQIRLEDDQLHFHYECALELCEPLKIYEVLREISMYADNYDDEYITKFNGTHIREPQIRPFDTEKKDKAWELTQIYIQEAFTAYEQLENKRLNQFMWDVLIITLLKIDFLCSPQGNLRNDIQKNIAYLSSKEDYFQRLNAAKDFLKRLQAMPKETFTRDLYAIEVFVPYKVLNNLDGVRKEIQYAYETASNEIKSGEHVGAMFTLEYGILHLFYENHFDDSIAAILMKALVDSSGKPVNEAAKILQEAVHAIRTTSAFPSVSVPVSASSQTEEKGFFRKLFGI